ncbi:hypothetical protein EDD16DRAFT_88724 [Pisolithus croceorrhizus]|nr:hypothetical protein EDD16DRAFT_88724 [Pisolithus croceorrhizus]KAI6111692.1 hypothetical protein EV401DRAFT_257524 [Pisolithus croceorrhizus]KAI6158379.1 hypothetical protein EDD17DRAFT_1016027 [Pisolithus thermaeus]
MGPLSRDSNAIRASVLETALELGIVQNPLVANRIFNSPLEEEPEVLQQESSNNAEPKTYQRVDNSSFGSQFKHDFRSLACPLFPPEGYYERKRA